MIDPKTLTVDDAGRKVLYRRGGEWCQSGTLTSWNTDTVFVAFSNPTRLGVPCKPEDVVFAEGEPMSEKLEPIVTSDSTGHMLGWSVEARKSGLPIAYGTQIFDGEWRQVQFVRGEHGIPIADSPYNEPMLAHAHLRCYQSAQALRWWLSAIMGHYSIETRLVRHEIDYVVKITRTSEHNEVTMDNVFQVIAGGKS